MKYRRISKEVKLTTFAALVLAVFILPALFSSLFLVSDSYATASSISISLSSAPSVSIASTSEGKFGDSGNSTITITTTHAAGYTLTAKASNSTNLEGTNGGSIPSITSAVSPTNYADNTYASSHNLNDTWAYKPSVLYNASTQTTNPNTDYLPSPGTGTAQSPIDTLAVTNDANDGSYTVSIGARVSTATAIDEYSNAFIFAVVGNPTPYAITYNKNTTDTVTNMPTNHTTSDPGATGETVTIDSTVPVRDGYTFKGWCSTTTSDDTCSGTVYNPDGGGTALNLTINQTSSTNAFTLYAMWKVDGINLYDAVAAQLKTNSTACTVTAGGKCSQDDTGLKAVITTPTSSNPAQDTSNSGVFAYNANVFGTASDASNDNTIYYFRGILDSNIDPSSFSSPNYGSNGNSAYYQNYVRLGDTCWRIFRTTGSGGVKMIYNGSYSGGTTANSCANAQTNAQLTTAAFNDTSATVAGTSYTGLQYQNMHAGGYTYSNVAAGTTTNTRLSTLLGSSGNDTTTNTNSSIMKKYIETGWYQQNLTSYTSILEPNAGYCVDRTVFNNTPPYTQQAESTNVIPYGTSGLTYYNFGARTRNFVPNGTRTLTLTCPRGRVDTYSTTTASGGNGQLTYPVALITADEAALSGSGRGDRTSASIYSSNYSYGSFLRSGSGFWLLSPTYRVAGGNAYNLYNDGGGINNTIVYYAFGVRPAISLTSGTVATSGSGIATDPWVVNAP